MAHKVQGGETFAPYQIDGIVIGKIIHGIKENDNNLFEIKALKVKFIEDLKIVMQNILMQSTQLNAFHKGQEIIGEMARRIITFLPRPKLPVTIIFRQK